jgi:hypothetical protein
MKKFLLLFLGVLLLTGFVAADDKKKKKSKIEKDPEVVEAGKEEAKTLLKALDKALKDKKAEEKVLIDAIEPMIAKSSEKFFKSLTKAAKHKSMSVRVVAIKAIGSQKEPAKKIGSTLFNLMKSKQNKHSAAVIAMTIDSFRRQNYSKKPVADEIESHFRKAKYPLVMKACARYFGDMKMADKVKMLIEWVEAPQPASVNSASNPPASYWKRMWEIWDEIKDTVWYSLEKITGKDFKTTKEWRRWIRTPEAKKMGI